jgi:RNA polymerase sigma factor (sigma-70 family)
VTTFHQLDEGNILELTPIVTAVVRARVRDAHTADDLVQETLTRVLEAQPRLDVEALGPYAVVTARNLAAELGRSEARRQRHAHRFVDLREPERPEEEVLRREEREAVDAALGKLSERERAALIAHEVEDLDTSRLSHTFGSTPGGVASQLARARAKARVDYLLALRRQQPPTTKCRSVLVALSAGDRRRQAALDAGHHLLECGFCASYSEALVRRSRALAALVPVPWLGKAFGVLQRQFQTPAGQATAASVAVAGVAVAAFAVLSDPQPQSPPQGPPAPREQGTLIVAGKPFPVEAASDLRRLSGRPVRARSVIVNDVPSDEGFWMGEGGPNRVWVHLTGAAESEVRIVAGARVSFRGRIVSHSTGFARRMGVSVAEGGGLLDRSGQHIQASQGAIELS